MVARLQTAGFYVCDDRVERVTAIFAGVVLVHAGTHVAPLLFRQINLLFCPKFPRHVDEVCRPPPWPVAQSGFPVEESDERGGREAVRADDEVVPASGGP